MNYSANSCESSENENRDTPQQQIIEMGSTVVKNKRGTIHCLTIIGQVEGHTTLPPNVKTTKYEHVLPLLASIEESQDIDGLLLLLNTVGGDIEAGLAIAELIAGMKKPTVSRPGWRALHRRAAGRLRQAVDDRSDGEYDDPPGADERRHCRRAADVPVF